MRLLQYIRVNSEGIWLNGRFSALPIGDWAEALYRQGGIQYPKFFKMDHLCRIGWMASELLLAGENDRFEPRTDRAVILFNRSGSLCNDTQYQTTIQDPDNYFPSPALFVYTLPNIVTGEIAIRNGYRGETSCYLLPDFDAGILVETSRQALQDPGTRSLLTGWVECAPGQSDDLLLCLVDAETEENWNEKNLLQLYRYGHL